MSDKISERAQRGVVRIENDVFHFPKFDDPVLEDGQVLRDFHRSHLAVSMPPGGPSLTRQDMAAECDINTIMATYSATGMLPAGSAGVPYYADFTAMPSDLGGALSLMQDAEDAFMTLPALVRKEFDNDPVAFVDFASDVKNVDKMREWGLAPPKPAEAAGAVSGPGATSGGSPAPAAPAASPDAAPGVPSAARSPI